MRIKLKLFLISILISFSSVSAVAEASLPQLAFENLEPSMRVSQDGLNLLSLSTNRSSDSLEYSLRGDDAAYFTVDSDGHVLFKKPHNYKEQSSYRLTFTVDDTSDNSASGEATFSSILFLVVREGPLYEDDHWEPSRAGECTYDENVSPALNEITLGLSQNNNRRTIFEPTEIFDDETTTLMVSNPNVISSETTIPFSSIQPASKYTTIDGEEPDFLYDDGTHGDLVAGDGVWTLSCLTPGLFMPRDRSYKVAYYFGLSVVFHKYRGTEPGPQIISPTLSVNDTGFFYKNNQHYLIDSDQSAGIISSPETSDALNQIWDYKGSIFNLYAMSTTHGGWSAGMWRIHDFIGGTGATTDGTRCDNYSHCYSFSDGQDHPELIAGMHVGGGLGVAGLTHEVQHALLGFTMKDFPEANADGACDGNPDCTRELSTDYAHIEANTTLNSDLKGPPWNPEFGYPNSVRILKSNGSTRESNVIYDEENQVFKIIERTRAMQYGMSDFLLYHQGLLSAEDALKDEYKIIGYTFPECELDNKDLLCPDGYEFPYEEVIKFNVTDSIAKFGGYSNPRGLDVYDPANITLAMIQVSGRNHTEAEYTIDSKIYRSWANDGPDEDTASFDGVNFEGDAGDAPWAFTTRGLGRIILDFSSRIDTDYDGLPNDCDSQCIKAGLIEDTDDDNDGVLDGNDDAPLDPTNDSDADGTANNEDAFPLNNSETLDTDLDGVGNIADSDDDNDGVLDSDDAFPLDGYAYLDTDGDGKADQLSALLVTFVEVSSLETTVIEYEGPLVPFSIGLDERAVITFTFDGYPEDCSFLLNSVSMICNAAFNEIIVTDAGEYTFQLLDSFGDGGSAATISIQELTPANVSPTGIVLDQDDDNDGVLDVDDTYPINRQYSADSDLDGIPDKWETNYGLDPNDASDATSDQDNDGVTALDEFLGGTVPVKGTLDLDGNEDYDALTDGLLLLRGMFGLSGSALVTGTVSSDSTFTESVDIESRIANLRERIDVDGNGDVDALTDGLLTLRYLFGLQGEVLIDGVVAPNATRKTSEAIEAHLETLMPAF
jgi:hypothetical protein